VVDEVRREALGVTSVVVSGRDIDRLGARAGQYLLWRFLGRPVWTRAHPFSLSAAPERSRPAFTAVHVGPDSTALDHLHRGARVLVEGPCGRLHAGVRTGDKVLLMASGIGVTRMRALLEGLPTDPATWSSSTGSTRRPTSCSGTSWPRWPPSAARGS
jgi:ferredoxin-NADP reductase